MPENGFRSRLFGFDRNDVLSYIDGLQSRFAADWEQLQLEHHAEMERVQAEAGIQRQRAQDDLGAASGAAAREAAALRDQ
ncbi:MAG: hypothetical protein FWF49_05140, partial [Oscillospiraceae bacterium]|nr:hypothetical protein [Oscillospiraceae bacterium]